MSFIHCRQLLFSTVLPKRFLRRVSLAVLAEKPKKRIRKTRLALKGSPFGHTPLLLGLFSTCPDTVMAGGLSFGQVGIHPTYSPLRDKGGSTRGQWPHRPASKERTMTDKPIIPYDFNFLGTHIKER